MSWCDKLASVPAAGFRLTPHFASSDSILDGLSPILALSSFRDRAPRPVSSCPVALWRAPPGPHPHR